MRARHLISTEHWQYKSKPCNTAASPAEITRTDVAAEPKRCKPNYLHQRQSIQCSKKAHVVGAEKNLTRCLGRAREFGVFQAKAIQHPLTEQGHSFLPVVDSGTTRQQPLRNAAKGMAQGQKCNNQQITRTFACPLQR